MRVGIVIYGSLSTPTGGYLYDRKLVEYLRDQGDQVKIFSLDKKRYLQNIFDNFSRTFLRRLIKSKIDVLLEDELNHPSLFYINRELRNKVRYPIVTIVHHLSYSASLNMISRFFYRILEKSYLSSVNGFIFNSRTNKDFIESFMGKSLVGVVAYPGRDHICHKVTQNIVSQRVNRSQPLQILFVGNLLPHKGLHTLIKALSIIEKERWSLAVIGNFSISKNYTESVKNLIQKNNLDSRVELLGFVDNDELSASFKKSHLLVVPSIYEGFGIVYLEALGFGIPVIATTNGAAKEIIRHSEEGFLVPPEDPQSLARHISILINNPDLLNNMSRNSIKRYEDFPTWSTSMKRIRDFLVTII